MNKYCVFALFFLLSCKPNTDATHIGSDTVTVADEGNDPENNPVMGGPSDIKINLVNNNKSGTAKIIGFYSDQNYLADTVSYSNGKLHYFNEKGLPQGYYYFAFSDNEIVQLILDHDQKFEVSADLADLPNSVKITGSDDNSLFYEVTRWEQGINPQIMALSERLKSMQEGSAEYNKVKLERTQLEEKKMDYLKKLVEQNPKSLFANFKYGGQNPRIKDNLPREAQFINYRNEFWDNVNFNDRRLLRTPMVGNKLKRYFNELTVQHHDSIYVAAQHLMEKVMDKKEYFKIFANWIVIKFEPTKCPLMDAESVFVNMVENYFTREKAFWADSLTVATIQRRAYEMSSSLVGKPAPNVISTDPQGEKQELLSKKADYLIVYMFNPDCEHCMEETPKLLQYYLENKSKGVDVFAIALDTDETKWKNYIQKQNLTWTNVYDPTNRSIYAKYYVDVTPEIYVINKERKIIGKNLKTFQIPAIIDKDRIK